MLFGILEGKQGAGTSDDLRELEQLAARVRTGPGVPCDSHQRNAPG